MTAACGFKYEPTDNVLPAATGNESETETPPDVNADSLFPATFRIDCIDILQLGDAEKGTGNFQITTLQDTWNSDIAEFRLSILLDLIEVDETAGTATTQIRSGVGFGWTDQCSEMSTDSAQVSAVYEAGVSAYAPMVDAETNSCSAPDAAAVASGTLTIDTDKSNIVYIYAEDNDGVAFNCALDGTPDAIPVKALQATVTLSEDGVTASGELLGCMTENDANQRCTCLGKCAGNDNPDCPDCPGGSIKLGALLGGINATDACTARAGETAFDVRLRFTARRLGEVPNACNG